MRRALAGLLAAASLLVAGCVQPNAELDPAAGASAADAGGLAVIAHIDTGINPYARAFRDDSALAYVHPSEYLPGYPADTPALWLTLNATDLATAYEADKGLWENVSDGQPYWIPGTRIVAAVSFGAGGTNCPAVSPAPPLNLLAGSCEDRPILDDHGHGTMTASRMAAGEHSLCPTCRIVSIEGTGGGSVVWAADQGWIDVQTNSWLSLVPAGPLQAFDGTSEAFAYAADKMVAIAASGNGAAYVTGFAPTPTYLLSTAAPGVVLVGAHDNGRVSPWSGAPAHVLADGFAGFTALRDSIDAIEPNPIACCSSAAAPYAAGGAARIVQEARALLGDTGVGLRDGRLAVGNASVTEGPLADGDLTLDELRELLKKTASARPAEGPDDGDVHWGGQPSPPDPANPAGNPYCVGCWTTPVAFASLPEGAPLVAHAGYGAVDPTSVALALDVLAGAQPLPQRTIEDAFFAADAQLRALVFR